MYEHEEGFVDVYMMGTNYSKFIGKTIDISSAARGGINIKAKVVGRILVNYSVLLRQKPDTFVMDSHDLYQIYQDQNIKEMPNLTVQVEDKTHTDLSYDPTKI
ncbi:hypothetical protein Zmor_016468 [Zophobas morio]|uniref:Uncharacterized protein n=1 Tax=Zophobas morio TaxID=2755281 RepID=A0AA38HJS6_9CUCU|nr:hypothetical protein Zmor_016468 [Zophobas morio]